MKKQIIFIDGPRQIGKSYLISEMFDILTQKGVKVGIVNTKFSVCQEQKSRRDTESLALEYLSGWIIALDKSIGALNGHLRTDEIDVVLVHQGFHTHITNCLINGMSSTHLTYLKNIQSGVLDMFSDQYDFRHISLLQTHTNDLPQPENLSLWLETVKLPGFSIEYSGLTSGSAEKLVSNYKAEDFN